MVIHAVPDDQDDILGRVWVAGGNVLGKGASRQKSSAYRKGY
jgi:hypothetical protein